jgi:hypothetical protein
LTTIYASDPNSAPDSEFRSGELRYLVVGNRGRLLDARRTPIMVMAIDPVRGSFEVEIGAFEDAGARWDLPLEDVARFQFARRCSVAADDLVSELERARRQFDRDLIVGCDAGARSRTVDRIEHERGRIRHRLASVGPVDVAACVRARSGEDRLFDLLDEVIGERGLADLEHRFASTFVSNPGSGEFVKAHAIVLAELGLCPYCGRIVRDPSAFEGLLSKERRAEHLITRLAFTQELWSRDELITLYRGAAVEGPLPEPAWSSFVSATFSREVATAHFEGGPTTRTAVLWRQLVPITRVFMTFLETREMNRRFNEAEAVLIGDSGNRAF